jgi:hypothetical protein
MRPRFIRGPLACVTVIQTRLAPNMPYLVGTALALAVCCFATLVRLDRERAFYTTVMIVIASYYGLFAAMRGSSRTLVLESVVIVAFVTGAVVAFKRSMWILVALLCAHGLLDLFHAALISNPGVPGWWPAFCMTYDVTTGAYLACLLHRAGR